MPMVIAYNLIQIARLSILRYINVFNAILDIILIIKAFVLKARHLLVILIARNTIIKIYVWSVQKVLSFLQMGYVLLLIRLA